MWNRLKQSSLATDYRFLILSLLSLLGLMVVFNEKSYILVVLLFGWLIFDILKLSVLETIFFCWLLVLPFERGIRGWTLEVVRSGPEPWLKGYSFYFGFSLKMIFLICLLMLLLRVHSRLRKIKYSQSSWWLIGFLIWGAVGSLVNDSNFSLLGLLRLMMSIGGFIVSYLLFQDRKVRKKFIWLVLSWLVFLGLVGLVQLVKKGSWGLFLEDSAFLRPEGFFTTDGERLYRVSGLSGHPTFFGSFLTMLIPVVIGMGLKLRQKGKKMGIDGVMILTALIMGTMALIGTYSRSSWMALLISGVLFWLIFNKKKQLIDKVAMGGLVGFGGLVAVMIGPMIAIRTKAINWWSVGNIQGRWNLVKQAGLIIKEFPVFGVGLNRFTAVMAGRDLSLELRTFMFPVHNTFILFLAETGIVGGALFLVFFIKSLLSSFKKAKIDLVNFGVWLGVLNFGINAQFHTLFNQDPSFDLLMVMLAYLATI